MNVELLGTFGNDLTVVESARISFNKQSVEQDRRLIRYLLRNRHTSPFEMVEYRFKIHCPIFVARQILRHRTASVNEVSGRYSEIETEFYYPDYDRIKGKGKINKQGSEGEVEPMVKKGFRNAVVDFSWGAKELYKANLEKGISNELSRIILPLNTYTTFIWKIDLHNLLHFLKLRLDEHTQEETRFMAEQIANYVKDNNPLTWEAFEDYQLNSITLSKQDIENLKKHLQGELYDYESRSELNEFELKLNKIGLI